MNPNLMNDVSELFNQPAILREDGTRACPVCDKSYHTAAGVFKHMASQDCAPPLKLFEGTMTETLALPFFRNTVGNFSKTTRTSLTAFRKSKYYSPVLRYVLNCMNLHLDAVMLFEYALAKNKPKYFNHALSLASKTSTIQSYILHRVKHEELIDSEAFYEKHEHRLLSDSEFLLSSIRRGSIGLDFCLKHNDIDLMDRSKDFSRGLKLALIEIIDIKEN